MAFTVDFPFLFQFLSSFGSWQWTRSCSGTLHTQNAPRKFQLTSWRIEEVGRGIPARGTEQRTVVDSPHGFRSALVALVARQFAQMLRHVSTFFFLPWSVWRRLFLSGQSPLRHPSVTVKRTIEIFTSLFFGIFRGRRRRCKQSIRAPSRSMVVCWASTQLWSVDRKRRGETRPR